MIHYFFLLKELWNKNINYVVILFFFLFISIDFFFPISIHFSGHCARPHILSAKFCNRIIMQCTILSQHQKLSSKRRYCKTELLTHYKRRVWNNHYNGTDDEQ